MPLDQFGSYDFFYKRCVREIKWSFIPRRCYSTGKIIWMTTGYKLTAEMYDVFQGTPIFEHRWFDRKEYLIRCLTGKI